MSTTAQMVTPPSVMDVNRMVAGDLLSKLRNTAPLSSVSFAPLTTGCACDTSSPRGGLRPHAWRSARGGRNTTLMPAGMPASYARHAGSMIRPRASGNWRPGLLQKRTR